MQLKSVFLVLQAITGLHIDDVNPGDISSTSPITLHNAVQLSYGMLEQTTINPNANWAKYDILVLQLDKL